MQAMREVAVVSLQAEHNIDAARTIGCLQDDEGSALEGANGSGRQP